MWNLSRFTSSVSVVRSIGASTLGLALVMAPVMTPGAWAESQASLQKKRAALRARVAQSKRARRARVAVAPQAQRSGATDPMQSGSKAVSIEQAFASSSVAPTQNIGATRSQLTGMRSGLATTTGLAPAPVGVGADPSLQFAGQSAQTKRGTTLTSDTIRTQSAAPIRTGSASTSGAMMTMPTAPATSVSKMAKKDLIAEAPKANEPKFVANYFWLLFGPSVSSPTASSQPSNQDAFSGNPVNQLNRATLGVKWDPSWTTTLNIDFLTSFVNDPAVKAFELSDPFVRINHPGYKSGDFSLGGHFRIFLPVSQGSRDLSKIVGFRHDQGMYYSIPNSRVALNFESFVRAFVYSRPVAGQKELEVYINPSIDLGVSDSFGFFTGYERQWGRAHLTDTTLGVEDQALHLGLSIKPVSNVEIRPYLFFRTAGQVNFQTTSIQMWINWSII